MLGKATVSKNYSSINSIYKTLHFRTSEQQCIRIDQNCINPFHNVHIAYYLSSGFIFQYWNSIAVWQQIAYTLTSLNTIPARNCIQ